MAKSALSTVMFLLGLVITSVSLFELASCLQTSGQAALQAPICKAQPGTSAWPSEQAWNLLNTSVSGKLLKPLPPGAVCDPTLDVFEVETCLEVAANYTKSNYHAGDPLSVQQPNWEHDACLPTTSRPCNTSQYPVYVINATDALAVQTGVRFARQNRVRLNVKGTGHDYLGRSTAPNSLSIWTHYIRGLRYHEHFRPCGSNSRYEDVLTIAAGHQMHDIYAEAAHHGRVIVGGMDPNVGIGGYITGGGHSPLSAHYGLAADQVVEIEMITPKGDFVTANEASNTDLFWAMRGGGGATFGVLLSVTVKTYPMPSLTLAILQFNQTASTSSDFWNAVARVHQWFPSLAASGLMGYYFVTPYESTAFDGPGLSFSFVGGVLNASEIAVEAILQPLVYYLKTYSGITVSSLTIPVPDFYTWWSTAIPPGAVGINVRLGSRLLDTVALSQLNTTFIAQKLEGAFNGMALLGHLISGPGVWTAKPPGGLGSMTPVWRKTVAHLVIPAVWAPYNDTAESVLADKLTNTHVASLRDLAPDMGCYVNEADVNEPDFRNAFWGHNYARLLEIKRKYDPDGVFYCKNCVGSEDMLPLDDGALCHKQEV